MEIEGLEVTRASGFVEVLEISSWLGDLAFDIAVDASKEKLGGGLANFASSGDVMDLRERKSSLLRERRYGDQYHL